MKLSFLFCVYKQKNVELLLYVYGEEFDTFTYIWILRLGQYEMYDILWFFMPICLNFGWLNANVLLLIISDLKFDGILELWP